MNNHQRRKFEERLDALSKVDRLEGRARPELEPIERCRRVGIRVIKNLGVGSSGQSDGQDVPEPGVS